MLQTHLCTAGGAVLAEHPQGGVPWTAAQQSVVMSTMWAGSWNAEQHCKYLVSKADVDLESVEVWMQTCGVCNNRRQYSSCICLVAQHLP